MVSVDSKAVFLVGGRKSARERIRVVRGGRVVEVGGGGCCWWRSELVDVEISDPNVGCKNRFFFFFREKD